MEFNLGSVVMTNGVATTIEEEKFSTLDLWEILSKYQSRDWGITNTMDQRENNRAVEQGNRVVAKYNIKGIDIFIVTEWDRSYTTILLPEEY